MRGSCSSICIIGAGLAGSECAYQLAKRGLSVILVEQRPQKTTQAHQTDLPAELVCSNSLRSTDLENACGLLKEEMACLDSLIIRAAYHARVPAGSALAVDREAFSGFVLAELKNLKSLHFASEIVTSFRREGDKIQVVCASGQEILCQRCVIATGPLTDGPLAAAIREVTGQDAFYFYDAIAPIVEKDSIDMTKAFRASRYQRGQQDEGDYINCPFTQEEYEHFVDELLKADVAAFHEFDDPKFFQGCMPIEEMARRGQQALSFGPMKPAGIVDQRYPDKKFGAIVQLRQDNLHNTLYNIVGFQTQMKQPEQNRVFRMIPGLEHATFARLGSMHRNTYLCSPVLLKEGMELKSFAGLHFAGQITGCEGYCESAAVGLYVGLCLSNVGAPACGTGRQNFVPLQEPPATSAFGALIHHILHADPNDYQPMNINFGILPEPERPFKKHEKKMLVIKKAITSLREWIFANAAIFSKLA